MGSTRSRVRAFPAGVLQPTLSPNAGTATLFGTSGDALRNTALRRHIGHDALITAAGSRSSGPSQHGDFGKVRGRAKALLDQRADVAQASQ